MGRYVSQDPIGLHGGMNFYAYPLDPLDVIDPSGLVACGPMSPRKIGEQAFNAVVDEIKSAAQPLTDFAKSVWAKVSEGVQGGPQVGGTVVVGVGVSSSTGSATDLSGKTCGVVSVCGLVGPMVGNYVSGSFSGSTGRVKPGDVSWQIGGVGSATMLLGGVLELSIANDGAIGAQAGGTMGGALGGALQICRQEVTKTCN